MPARKNRDIYKHGSTQNHEKRIYPTRNVYITGTHHALLYSQQMIEFTKLETTKCTYRNYTDASKTQYDFDGVTVSSINITQGTDPEIYTVSNKKDYDFDGIVVSDITIQPGIISPYTIETTSDYDYDGIVVSSIHITENPTIVFYERTSKSIGIDPMICMSNLDTISATISAIS